ncbi:putative translation machinery-associated protein [Scheffersomyces xylosifermentans]|uniref:putative translation machinery-associated protein n=1 Tax=Scheffersomyces xylosifermentans TaxID=1304137 RepID=UPI00315D95A8
MPPKKKAQAAAEKAAKAKAKAKNSEDKTFGMKNKNKSKRVQQEIQQIKAGIDGGMAKKKEAEAKRLAAEKKAAEDAKKEAAALMGIVQQKVPFGVDPKSILCEFFKKGLCTKGAKCKFSHDLNVGRKDAKKDLYTDARTEKEEDTMDNWDEEKLRKVISSKHGNPQTTTDKVCKHFIEAVENGKYGWFWVCPNGGNDCKYRHSLPPGFVLKTKEQKRAEKLAAEAAPKITLEEFLELERMKLDKSKFTPITIETFKIWKQKQLNKRAEDKKKEEKSGRRLRTGKEVILEKFADKFYSEEDEGDQWDLSQFKKAVPEDDDENVKDYGDGSNVQEYYLKDSEEDKKEETNGTAEAVKTENKEPVEEDNTTVVATEEVEQIEITETKPDSSNNTTRSTTPQTEKSPEVTVVEESQPVALST